MKNLDLMNQYVERLLGHSINEEQPVKLNGDKVSEILWPLNELFRPNLAAIQSLSYETKYEREADSVIAELAFNPQHDLSEMSAGAWRVFLERHCQTLMLTGLQLQIPFLSVPSNLPAQARLGFLLLFQYHEMPLPFPVQDRSGGEFPQAYSPDSLRQHLQWQDFGEFDNT